MPRSSISERARVEMDLTKRGANHIHDQTTEDDEEITGIAKESDFLQPGYWRALEAEYQDPKQEVADDSAAASNCTIPEVSSPTMGQTTSFLRARSLSASTLSLAGIWPPSRSRSSCPTS